jgi:hypothetical protein
MRQCAASYSLNEEPYASQTPWHGLVLFARGPVPENVIALFTLHQGLQ